MSPSKITNLTDIIENQKLTRFIAGVVAVSTLVTFFDGFDMNVISLVAPEMSAALRLSKVMMGNVFSAGLAGTMAGGFLFGYLGDRIGRRPSILLATLWFGLLTLSLALARDYPQLLALRFVQGIGIGGLLPLSWALNIDFVPRAYQATVVTVLMLGYSLGDGFAGPVSIWLASRGWPAVFLFGGCAALGVAALLYFFLPESIKFLANRNRRPDLIAGLARRLAPEQAIAPSDQFILPGEPPRGSRDFILPMLFHGDLRWITPLLWVAYIASSVAVFLRVSWGPTILQAIGYSRSVAAYTTSASAIGGALGGLALMRFTDVRGAISIALFPALTAPLLLAMGFSGTGGVSFLVMYFFATFLLVGAHTGLHSIAGIFYPSSYRSNGAGWATSIAKIGSILGPMIGGLLLTTALPVRMLFAALAVCPLVVGASVFGLGRVQRRLRAKEKSGRWAAAAAVPSGAAK